VSVFLDGQLVVDLWVAGRPDEWRAWKEETRTRLLATKGVTAVGANLLIQRGARSRSPGATLWPEFAANGKGAITVGQVLSHQAGLVRRG